MKRWYECAHELYADEYRVAFDARDAGMVALTDAATDQPWCCADDELIVRLAVGDAARGLPMRSKALVCRRELVGRCARHARLAGAQTAHKPEPAPPAGREGVDAVLPV